MTVWICIYYYKIPDTDYFPLDLTVLEAHMYMYCTPFLNRSCSALQDVDHKNEIKKNVLLEMYHHITHVTVVFDTELCIAFHITSHAYI